MERVLIKISAKMRTIYIVVWMVTVIALASCVKEFDSLPATDDTGTTRITFAIKSDSRQSDNAASPTDPAALTRGLPSYGGMPNSRALSPKEEQQISNVRILVFDAKGTIVSNEYIGGLTISGTTQLSANTRPGTNMQIWVIANVDVNDNAPNKLDDLLRVVTSTAELKTLLVNVKGDGLRRAERLTMVGSTTVTITNPHTATIPINLHFLAVKVMVTVIDNTQPSDLTITITGWDVVNIPKRTFLQERTEDAVTGKPDDYISTNSNSPFETTDAVTKTWKQTVYLFENRRGGRIGRNDPVNPDDKYPDMDVNDSDQRGKAWYAPPGATCMLIYGTHSKDGQKNDIVYKVFLGENPVNDYNLSRGKQYEYTVTINGLNDINIDSNVEWGAASFSVGHSDNLLMDAHPDFRVFRIGGTAVDAAVPAYATVEVLEPDGRTPCSWLAVSPVNLYRHAIGQSGNDAGHFVRTSYTSLTAESEFGSATFGMTRKLTKIPFNQPAVYTYQNIFVYAQGYEGTTDRRAKVHIVYYKGASGGEVVGERTYDVTQSGAIKVSEDLYIERYEEAAMLMNPGLAAGLQKSTFMQWGYNTGMLSGSDDRFSNGNWLTANAVYLTVQARNGMDAPTWTATSSAACREKFPRTGTKVVEPSSLSTTGAPYYYPELTSTTPPTDYFHPLFNASAARYCHEKNRDSNGDGIISADETVWYLPSFADMWYIATSKPAGLNLTGTYWTATEQDDGNSWSYTFSTSTNKEALAAKTTPHRVRCVKGKGIVLPEATIESTEVDQTKINLDSDIGASGAFAVADATGLTWTVTSGDASWLEVATASTGTGAAASLTGTGNKTYYAYATSANSSATDDRTATLTLTRMGMPTTPAKTVTVTQAKIVPAATMTPTTLTLQYLAGESALFTITNPATELEWTVTSNQSWLAIATNGAGAGAASSKKGTSNATFYAYAKIANTSITVDRSATITLSRKGQSDITIDVTQTKTQAYFPPLHKGWAGCNIYWDPTYDNGDGTTGRLTFDDVGEKTHENYQGVFFQWGSLVALSTIGAYNPSITNLFSPNGTTNYAWTAIPVAPWGGANTGGFINYGRSYLIEVHNPEKNIGDICKYISERGWAPGVEEGKTWRMPTADEQAIGNYTVWGDWTARASTNANGQHVYICGRRNNAGASFPASGIRNTDSSITYSYSYGYTWSASTLLYGGAYYALCLRFTSGAVSLRQGINTPHSGVNVRCVQN